jgi:hypothetical protein
MAKNKGVLKSFRLSKAETEWLVSTSKSRGITQTDVLKNLIKGADSRLANRKAQATIVQLESVEADDEAIQFLTSAGIGTASGLLGYHIAGWVREQMKLDEDKGVQLTTGLFVGLASVIVREYTRKRS